MTSINQIRQELDLSYDTIVTQWQNFFLVPRGNAGKNFLSEATRIINLYNNDTPLKFIALKSFSVFLPMMLQKPSHNSKAKDHCKHLQKLLQFWEKGDLRSILNKCCEMQKRCLKARLKSAAQLSQSQCPA